MEPATRSWEYCRHDGVAGEGQGQLVQHIYAQQGSSSVRRSATNDGPAGAQGGRTRAAKLMKMSSAHRPRLLAVARLGCRCLGCCPGRPRLHGDSGRRGGPSSTEARRPHSRERPRSPGRPSEPASSFPASGRRGGQPSEPGTPRLGALQGLGAAPGRHARRHALHRLAARSVKSSDRWRPARELPQQSTFACGSLGAAAPLAHLAAWLSGPTAVPIDCGRRA